MKHVEHARRELERSGQWAESPDYAQSIVAAIEGFTSYGHSGGSAEVATEQLHRLLLGETLSPLTSDPDEWEDRSDMSSRPWWQNRRDARAMSHDGGKTWWFVEPRNPGEKAIDGMTVTCARCEGRGVVVVGEEGESTS